MSHVRAIEVWRPVLGFEDLFQVSNCGGVRSPDRVIWPSVNPQGYRHVSLVGTRRSVHSLVLEAFVGPRPTGLLGLHWDDNPANNHLSNLRWGTHADNRRDSIRNGTYSNGRPGRTHCPRGHELAGLNLVTASLPVRICKACNRARAAMRHRYPGGYTEEAMRPLSDEHYERILSFVRWSVARA